MLGQTIIHAITPGDHFSPRTGSAIPTVVDGLARAATAAGESRQSVALDSSTYRPRYGSADVIEYVEDQRPNALSRRLDVVRGRVGLHRAAARDYLTPLADAIRSQPPAVVLAHNAPGLSGLLSGTAHATVLYAHNDLLRTYTKAEAGRTLMDVSAIVCVSESLAERTRSRLPRSLAERVHVVVNGVDAVGFTPGGPRSAGPLRIVFMGRIIRDKGADVLLRAAAALRGADAEVLIVGRPGFDPNAPLSDYERELRRLARASELPVRFTGFIPRDAMPALLRTADVFVVPSRWPDPAPLTVGEAIATGLPTIASRIGGIPEVLGDAGILVPPDNPVALADVLRRLIADPAERARMSVAARARAETHDWSWSWRHLARVLSDL